MNTNGMPPVHRKAVKRSRRKMLKLGSRCALSHGHAVRRLLKAQLAYATAWNRAARATGLADFPLISGDTLRPRGRGAP